MHRAVLSVALAILTCPALAAQLPGPGLGLSTSSGGAAGSLVFDCTPLDVVVLPGDTVTLSVQGDVDAPYALFRAATATGCRPIAGFVGDLVLDPPLVFFETGVLTQITPCLACPPAYETITFVVPPTFPPGEVAIQAASFGGGRLAFTSAIRVTVP